MYRIATKSIHAPGKPSMVSLYKKEKNGLVRKGSTDVNIARTVNAFPTSLSSRNLEMLDLERVEVVAQRIQNT